MLINGWDVASAHAKQWNVSIGLGSLSSESDWTVGHIRPTVLSSDISWKPVKIVVLIKGKDRNEITGNASLIISKVMQPCEINLDGFNHIYYGYCKSHTLVEKSIHGNMWSDLTLNMQCCEYGVPISYYYKEGSPLLVRNPGNLNSPCRIELITKTDTTDAVSISGLTGNSKITFSRMRANHRLILDSITGEYSYTALYPASAAFTLNRSKIGSDDVLWREIGENGKPLSPVNRLGYVDLWEVPAIAPGDTKIAFSVSNPEDYIKDLSVTLRPAYA